MIRNTLCLLALMTLAGCQMWGTKPVEVPPKIVKEVELVPLRIYQPPVPAEIDLLDVNFFIITEENLEEQVAKIEKMLDGQFVVFALTPDGYEKMAENLQEIRRFIRQQTELIIYYREATTESEGTTAEDWLKKNEEKTS